MPGPRRRGGVPDPAALGELAAPGRLPKAPSADPVLGATSPQERAGRATGAPPPVPDDVPAARTARAPSAKAQFYDLADELARARAAYLHTHAQEGHRSWSEFVAATVRREVRRLEALYHGGEPWPDVAAGQIPTGRPLGR